MAKNTKQKMIKPSQNTNKVHKTDTRPTQANNTIKARTQIDKIEEEKLGLQLGRERVRPAQKGFLEFAFIRDE